MINLYKRKTKTSKFIVKVPGINGLGKTKGCRNAGNAIIKKFKSTKNLDFEEIHVDNENLPEQESLIYKNSLETFETKPQAIFLGGDHSISYPIGKAFSEYCNKQNKNPFLIIFDAHADCMSPMKEPTHEEWLRALIEREKFPKENIILVGAREIEPVESQYVKENNIKSISVNKIKSDIQSTIKEIIPLISNKTLYISFDIDVFDSSIVKATGYPSANGITEKQAIKLLSEIIKTNPLKVFDLVEVNLEKEKQEVEKTLEIARSVLETIMT